LNQWHDKGPLRFQKIKVDFHFDKIKVRFSFIKAMHEPTPKPERWIDLLSEEDLAFLKRFILTSGSLKDLAAAYGVTYPTVRLRLDRMIDKIKIIDAHDGASAYERLLRGLFAEGKIDEASFKLLLKTYQQQKS
jgi:hypothetical protein